MSSKNIGFLDVREISSDVLVDLFLDILTDEKSILRRVFGLSLSLLPPPFPSHVPQITQYPQLTCTFAQNEGNEKAVVILQDLTHNLFIIKDLLLTVNALN